MNETADRVPWLRNRISPTALLIFGLLCAPTFIIQDVLLFKILQAAVFAVLSILSAQIGRGWWATLIFFFSIVVLNLLSPFGRVLCRWGPFAVTEGALQAGLSKGLTLLGLFYLSRFCIRSSLSLPGALGRYVSKTLLYFDRLLRERPKLDRKDIWGSIDRLLERVSLADIENSKKQRLRIVDCAFLGGLLVVNWGLVFF